MPDFPSNPRAPLPQDHSMRNTSPQACMHCHALLAPGEARTFAITIVAHNGVPVSSHVPEWHCQRPFCALHHAVKYHLI